MKVTWLALFRNKANDYQRLLKIEPLHSTLIFSVLNISGITVTRASQLMAYGRQTKQIFRVFEICSNKTKIIIINQNQLVKRKVTF